MGWWIHGVGAAVSNLSRDLGSLHGSRPWQPARHSPQKPGHGEEHRLLPAADKGKTRSLCRKEGNVLFNDTLNIVRDETRCCHMGYSFRLTARVPLYAPSHRQDSTYHSLCYTTRGALAGTRNSSMGPPHEGSIRRPIAPWANALPLSYVPLPDLKQVRLLAF